MKLNNKGFTLVELLAVLVILIAISSIAIPTISSSIDRNKDKQYRAKIKLVESAAELYITDNRNYLSTDDDHCFIMVKDLTSDNYFDKDDDISPNSCVKYTFNGKTFDYIDQESDCDSSMTCVMIAE